MAQEEKIKEIQNKIKEEGIRFIELQFTDMQGKSKNIDIPITDLETAIKKGIGFDGSSIEGFARIKESDMYLKPDLETFATHPWTSQNIKTARLICDIYTPKGELYEDSPRSVLKKAIKKGEEKGYELTLGPEVEFYLLKKINGTFKLPDSDSYFDTTPGSTGTRVRREVMSMLKDFGITSERGHHEVGAGQYEIGFKYDNALRTADNVITLKRIIRTIANKNELLASFMPKPFTGKMGNGMHIHFSLFEREENKFYDATDPQHLSETAKQFIAGVLEHIKKITILLNPTINSYKRLVKGYEAPVYVCWGDKNRSALIRIPQYQKGRTSSARAEIRSPDPSANPYLAFAALYYAGLKGIEDKLTLRKPIGDNLYELTEREIAEQGIELLPRTLNEALEEFRQSKLMEELFGESLFEKYVRAKQKEIEDFTTTVTEWERERYLKN
ncbi:MAG TPA: glutamine synthetase [Candidatus Woesearchaeota archaeon]|nr:glutamine synthetase [Candidatus Woesearchaeota archaeon]